MIYKRIWQTSFLLICLAFSLNSTAQSKKVWLFKADAAYEARDYATALRYYHMVLDDTLGMSTKVLPYEVVLSNQKLEKDSTKAKNVKTVYLSDYVYHQMAMCYRYSHDYENSAIYFKMTSERDGYIDDQYYYANVLMNLGRYDEALVVLEKYITQENAAENLKARAYQDISGCNYALIVEEPEEKITVELADTTVFNAGNSSFAAMYWGGSYNKVIFTSARQGGVILDPEEQDSRFLCDLYWSELGVDSTWSKAHNFGRPLNSCLLYTSPSPRD